jgi:hypothetical protein
MHKQLQVLVLSTTTQQNDQPHHQAALIPVLATIQQASLFSIISSCCSLTVAACCDEAVVCDHVGHAALLVHLLKQLQRKLAAARLLTRTDQAAVRDHVALTATPHHVCAGRKVSSTAATAGKSTLQQVTPRQVQERKMHARACRKQAIDNKLTCTAAAGAQ